MIIDKHQQPANQQPPYNHQVTEQLSLSPGVPNYESDEYAYTANGMVEAYKSIKTILASISKDPNFPDGEKLFRTIKWDNGQLSRIKNNKWNLEYGNIVFPAVFIHFIDMYWNQGTAGISEGRGIMRIHYVLNRMNNSDEDFECEGAEIADRIIQTIETQKKNFTPLVNRFQLQYWDQPLSHDDALQPYWLDYQIWLNSYTTYAYKNYVDAYAVIPPFVNHSDQDETANPDHRPNQEYDVDDSIGVITKLPPGSIVEEESDAI